VGPVGFAFRVRKNGDVHVFHHGTLATTLRAERARAFLAAVESADTAGAQQLMARVTGNYRRGNERQTGSHPRQRR